MEKDTKKHQQEYFNIFRKINGSQEMTFSVWEEVCMMRWPSFIIDDEWLLTVW